MKYTDEWISDFVQDCSSVGQRVSHKEQCDKLEQAFELIIENAVQERKWRLEAEAGADEEGALCGIEMQESLDMLAHNIRIKINKS